MNNSFARLIDGMIEVLRLDIIPATDGEFVRGQAFGVIYMLESLKLRGDWSPAFIGEQIAALQDLREALIAQPDVPAVMPRLSPLADSSIETRDRGDGEVAELLEWLATQSATDPVIGAIRTGVDAYLTRQIRHELKTSAKPMFAEISLGHEPQDKD